MKVEIWSDVMCPFCYIGKRKFEKALAQFAQKEKVEISWRSFELNPELKPEPGKSVTQYLSERKGISLAQARQMNQYVTQVAAAEGLAFHLDKAVIANSFDAHRFSHFAATKGLGDAAEEALFKAYFTDGKDTGSHEVLAALGESIGLNAAEVRAMLQSDRFAAEVRSDEERAAQIGVRGVPFFVLENKYAVSGAQPSELFLSALQQTWEETQPLQPVSNMSCDADGNCE